MRREWRRGVDENRKRRRRVDRKRRRGVVDRKRSRRGESKGRRRGENIKSLEEEVRE